MRCGTVARGIRRHLEPGGGDRGAVAILFSLVFVGLILPLLAYGTSLYVTTGTAADLHHGTDSGALAGAARIPLLQTGIASNDALAYLGYVEDVAGQAGDPVVQSLPFDSPALDTFDQEVAGLVADETNYLGLAGTPYVDPRTTAKEQCQAEALQTSTLARSFVTSTGPNGQPLAICKAKYAPRAGVITNLKSCVTAASNAVGAIGAVDALDPTGAAKTATAAVISLLNGVQSIAPLLARPGIAVQATWVAHAPFDGIVGGAGHTQTSVSYAQQQLKNVLVLPDTLGVNANVPAQAVTDQLNNTLTTLQTALPTLSGVLTSDLAALLGGLPVLGESASAASESLDAVAKACDGVIAGSKDEIDQILDPPSDGPDTLAQIQQAINDREPISIVTIADDSQIPFLDFVPTCFDSGDVVTQLAQLLPPSLVPPLVPPGVVPAARYSDLQNCLAAQGVQRATLASSAVTS